MRRLVDDLLLIVRIDQGLAVFRRPVTIKPLIRNILTDFHPLIREKRLTVSFACSDKLTSNVDIELLSNAVQHLLLNAIKFSPEGGHITVSAAAFKGNGLEISVADQGEGIAPEMIDKIFDRFFQVDFGDQRENGGLGLGLSIAREVASAHGGELCAASQPGEGSTFTMRLLDAKSDWQTGETG